MKKRILSKAIAFLTISIAIQFFYFNSSAISEDLKDIEKFSPLSEKNMPVIAQEENATSFIQPDGQWGSGYRCGTLPPTLEQTEAVQQAIDKLLRNRWLSPNAIPCTVNIPVAFHIIRYNDGVTGNVTNQQINDQLAVLNNAYASTSFQFVFHSIERVNNTAWSQQNTNADEVNMKQALAISPATTLNFYTGTLGGGLLGWATFPWYYTEDSYMHGVVVRYSSLPGGSAFPYDEGDTGTHEVGHYLGLYHTFQGGCLSPGDYIDDTPYEASPAYGCPAGRDTCVQPGGDPIFNFMDYSDDVCMNHFTADQSFRMDAQVELYKPSLISCGNGFTDVPPDHWAKDYIYAIFNAGITQGCSQNPLKYCPQDLVSRAQMAAFIVRAKEGEPPANYCATGSPFADVSSGTWPCKYIKRLSEMGITQGCGPGVYCPNRDVTRAEMAAFLVRAVEGEPPANYCATGSPFSDVSSDTWPCKYIKRLLELEITKGCGPGIYCPDRDVTRAEMAAFLARAFLGMD